MGVIELRDADFDAVIHSKEWLIVDFWASWCGPCQMMNPLVEEIAEKMTGIIEFGKVNVDENPQTAQQFGIATIPSFVILYKGEIKDKVVGPQSVEALKQRIEQAMQAEAP